MLEKDTQFFLYFSHSDNSHATLVRFPLICGSLVQEWLRESFYSVGSFIADLFGLHLVFEMNEVRS